MNTALKQQPIDQNDLLINNLKSLMARAQINEAELARKTNIPQPTLHKILAGKTSDPRYSTLALLADFFGLTIETLFSENELTYEIKGSKPAVKTISIPILQWKECAKHPEFTANPENWSHSISVESEDKNLYALISKPSVEPRFPKGSILIISPSISPQDGDFVIAQYPQSEEAALRELSIDGPNRFLLALNGNSPAEKQEKNIKILGTLIQSRFIYRS